MSNGKVSLATRALGTCVICGKTLTNSESIESFIGPICSRKYKYFLDNVNHPVDEIKFKKAVSQLNFEVNTSKGLNEASNIILRNLSKGVDLEEASICLDAIKALGFNNLSYLVGSALSVKGYDGASVSKAIAKVGNNGKYFYFKSGKIKSKFWGEFFNQLKEIPGRVYNKDKALTSFPMNNISAKMFVDLCERWFPLCEIDDKIINLSKECSKEDINKFKNKAKECYIKKVNDHIHIKTPRYNSNFVTDLKNEIPGKCKKWDKINKVWIVEENFIEQAVGVTIKYFKNVEIDNDIGDIKNKIENERKFATAITVDEKDSIEITGGKLMPFQSAGVMFLESKFKENGGGAIVADDMGLGKTVQALAFLDRNRSELPAIVVCPASVKNNWAKQTKRWMGNNTSVAICGGSKYKFYKDIKKETFDISNVNINTPDVFIINYDILNKNKEWINKVFFNTIILDESHYIKEKNSARSKAANEISNNIKNKILLTGTPILNRPKEVWHQLNICDNNAWGNFYRFAYRYCEPIKTRFGTTFNGATNIEELNSKLIGYYMVRRRKKDVLEELPEKFSYSTTLDIKDNERKSYDEAVLNFKKWAYENGGIEKLNKVNRAEAITKLTALRKECALAKINTTIKYIKEWLDSNFDEQLVIFAHHNDVLDMVEKSLIDNNYKVSSIRGKHYSSNRQKSIEDFTSSKTRILVASILAAGTGTDGLQDVCQNMKVIERTWRPADLAQMEDRLYRIGQKNNVNIEYIDMENSIDDYMSKIIKDKMGIINKIIDGGDAETDISMTVMNKILRGDDDTN